MDGWMDADLRCFPLEAMFRSSPKQQDSTRHERMGKMLGGVKKMVLSSKGIDI